MKGRPGGLPLWEGIWLPGNTREDRGNERVAPGLSEERRENRHEA